MRIGILAPVATADVAHLLQEGGRGAPQGYPGAPFVATLIETLLKLGHEVVAFTSDRTINTNGNSAVLEGTNFRLWICPARPNGTMPRMQSPVGRIWDFFRVERMHLQRAVAQERTDVLHAHWTYEFAMVAIEARRPCVVTIHDSPADVLRLSPTLYTLGRYLMAQMVLKAGMPLTAVSPYVAKVGIISGRHAPTSIIANPLPAWLKTVASEQDEYGESKSPRSVAMVLGSWSAVKNPLPGIHAFVGYLQETDLPTELNLYGGDYGPGGKADQALRKTNINMRNIHLRGRLGHRQLLEEIKTASVLLHTSMTESFGMAVAEAMALGVPVIAGRRSGAMPWLLNDGHNGQLVDIQSPTAIKLALKLALGTAPEIGKQVALAKEAIWKCADADTVALQYVAAYRTAKETA